MGWSKILFCGILGGSKIGSMVLVYYREQWNIKWRKILKRGTKLIKVRGNVLEILKESTPNES